MLRLRVLALSGCVLMLGMLNASGQDVDLKAILQKSIDAHGGANKLDKFKAVNTKFKGTIQLMGASRAITGEAWFQKPDKLKHVNNIDLNGKDLELITVYDGKKLVRN